MDFIKYFEQSSKVKKEILELGVSAWHEVAEEHGIKPCNCFREKFAEKLGLTNDSNNQN